jgi:hypothetical protein
VQVCPPRRTVHRADVEAHLPGTAGAAMITRLLLMVLHHDETAHPSAMTLPAPRAPSSASDRPQHSVKSRLTASASVAGGGAKAKQSHPEASCEIPAAQALPVRTHQDVKVKVARLKRQQVALDQRRRSTPCASRGMFTLARRWARRTNVSRRRGSTRRQCTATPWLVGGVGGQR